MGAILLVVGAAITPAAAEPSPSGLIVVPPVVGCPVLGVRAVILLMIIILLILMALATPSEVCVV